MPDVSHTLGWAAAVNESDPPSTSTPAWPDCSR